MKLLPPSLILSAALVLLGTAPQVFAQDAAPSADTPAQAEAAQKAQQNPSDTMLNTSAPCVRFSHCIQETLGHKDPVDKVLYSTHALKYWTDELPLRDLVNALKLRSEALIDLHIVQVSSDTVSKVGFDPLAYAEEDYQKFLSFYPKHWLPLSGLARIAELRNDMKTARGYYWQSIQTNQVRAWRNLADFHFRTKEWQSAVNDLTAALKKDDELMLRKINIEPAERAQIYAQRAEAYTQLAQRQKAYEDQQAACQLDSTNEFCAAN